MARPDPKPIPHLTQSDIRRFWSKVDKTPGQGPKGKCWVWQGNKSGDGYGTFTIGPKVSVVIRRSHRIAFFLTKGQPGPLCVLHECDNPPCCNPDHLFLGTPADNMADCVRKNRTARGDRNAARMYPETHLRGERHPQAILSDAQVEMIRRLGKTGIFQHVVIANSFGASESHTSNIISGRKRRPTQQHGLSAETFVDSVD